MGGGIGEVEIEVDDNKSKKSRRRREFSKLEVTFVNEVFPENEVIDGKGNILCYGILKSLQVGDKKYFFRVVGGISKNIPTYTYPMTRIEIEQALQNIKDKGETLSKLQIYVSPKIEEAS